jgi:hypothetical protein
MLGVQEVLRRRPTGPFLMEAGAMNRRTFLLESTIVGAAFLRMGAVSVAAEAPLETTRIRMVHDPSICVTPRTSRRIFSAPMASLRPTTSRRTTGPEPS